MVRPVIVAVTPSFTCNTRPVPPTIVRPAAGPVMEFGPPVPVSTERAGRQGDGLGRGEGGRIEGDRGVAGLEVRQVDRRAQVQLAGEVRHSPSVATATTSGTDESWKAPMSTGESSAKPALIGRHPGDRGPLAQGGAAGQQGHGLGRPAVVAQRRQAQVGEVAQDDVVARCRSRSRPIRPSRSGRRCR